MILLRLPACFRSLTEAPNPDNALVTKLLRRKKNTKGTSGTSRLRASSGGVNIIRFQMTPRYPNPEGTSNSIRGTASKAGTNQERRQGSHMPQVTWPRLQPETRKVPSNHRTSGGSSAKASCLLEGTFLRWYRVSRAITSISIGLKPSRCSLFCAKQKAEIVSALDSQPRLLALNADLLTSS